MAGKVEIGGGYPPVFSLLTSHFPLSPLPGTVPTAMPWTRLLISAPPLLLAGLLTVSFVSVRTGQAQRRNELAVGVPADPDSLNPILMTTQGAANVTRLVFNGLVRFDENLEPAPDLAESWERTPTAIVFHLRKDVRWHDGAAFTAADVEFTWRAIMDGAVSSPRRSDFQLIESLEVVDAHTVRVVYRQPHAFALNAWTVGMLPRHLLAGRPAAWWTAHFNRQPVGTGPFRFAEWRTNEHIVLARNAD